jgi:SpoVK/Ycf46/Vps4 family AAA+-type ATPase
MTRNNFPPKNNKRRFESTDTNENNNKFNKHFIFNNDSSDNIYNPTTPTTPIISLIPKEYVIINKDVKNLQDLIDLGKEYDENKEYNIMMHILYKLIEPLTLLNEMVGMKQIKQEIVDHILFRIQNLDNSNDMMHTIIYGPPGVGKTEVARIISSIYLAMEILENNKFIKVKRSDLIGAYLGQTAKATQKCIDSAKGGVMFIDEVYSLGNKEGRDSYSKECIDTLNESLTENKADYICIVAGYEKDINECFFAYNKGLERRFPIRFNVDKYTPEELFLIFKKKVAKINWTLDTNITIQFFTDNYEYFNFFGGDIEILLMRIKKCHARRIFNNNGDRKLITTCDLDNGFNIFKQNKKIEIKNDNWSHMYL